MLNIIKFNKLTSTNKFALENIDKYPANSIICAEIQEAGRGRFDRKWISDVQNNCYISFILKPNNKYRKNFPNITQYLSVILCQQIEKYGVKPSIKWPNDVLVNGKKIAGILSEVALENSCVKAIVIGLGVNLNLSQDKLSEINIPATSLNLETSLEIDNVEFINKLAECFFTNYDMFLKEGFKKIRAEYLSYCEFIGNKITIKNPKPVCLGIASDICEDGTLEVVLDNGQKNKIYSGDVIVKNNI